MQLTPLELGALTPEQIKFRESRLTASRVAPLMTGDEDRILNVWRELVGDTKAESEDLSGKWPPALGSFTERFNLHWFQYRTGHDVTRVGESVAHPEADWAGCTLDGWDSVEGCAIECKHVGGFEPIERVIERYMPQMHWQMIVTKTTQCVLSVIEGAKEPQRIVVEYDAEYGAELWSRAEQFMECVRDLTPPVIPPPIAAPVKAVKTYNMTGHNEWADHAATWLETRDARKKNEKADKAIKELVPADAAKCHGHNIIVSRNKAGSLSIKPEKD